MTCRFVGRGFALMVVAATMSCSSDAPPATLVSDPMVVMTIVRDGPRVVDDIALINALDGNEPPPDEMVEIAACRNLVDWSDDVTLDLDIVVSASESLLRVAEMVDTRQVERAVAEAIETKLMDVDGAPADIDAVMGVSSDDLATYLRRRRQPPATESGGMNAVYAGVERRPSSSSCSSRTCPSRRHHATERIAPPTVWSPRLRATTT